MYNRRFMPQQTALNVIYSHCYRHYVKTLKLTFLVKYFVVTKLILVLYKAYNTVMINNTKRTSRSQ